MTISSTRPSTFYQGSGNGQSFVHLAKTLKCHKPYKKGLTNISRKCFFHFIFHNLRFPPDFSTSVMTNQNKKARLTAVRQKGNVGDQNV